MRSSEDAEGPHNFTAEELRYGGIESSERRSSERGGFGGREEGGRKGGREGRGKKEREELCYGSIESTERPFVRE